MKTEFDEQCPSCTCADWGMMGHTSTCSVSKYLGEHMTIPDFSTRKEMMNVYPDGPAAFYPTDEYCQIVMPGFIFCSKKCMEDWIELHKISGSRNNKAWEFVKDIPVCEKCKKKLWGTFY